MLDVYFIPRCINATEYEQMKRVRWDWKHLWACGLFCYTELEPQGYVDFGWSRENQLIAILIH